MFNKVVLLILGFAAFASAEVVLESCGTGIPMPDDVWSKYCEETPCQFYQNEPIGFNMTFISGVASNALTVKVMAKLSILETEHVVAEEHKHACDHLREGKCPVAVGDLITYEMDMPLKASLTNIDVRLKVSLLDDTSAAAVCFMFQARINA